MTDAKTRKIADLNDRLRTTFTGGMVVLTPGIQALTDADRARVFLAVIRFTDFNEDNDPYHQHDMVFVTVPSTDGVSVHKVMAKVDTYDLNLEFMSPAPEDPAQTKRVLTLLLASEY